MISSFTILRRGVRRHLKLLEHQLICLLLPLHLVRNRKGEGLESARQLWTCASLETWARMDLCFSVYCTDVRNVIVSVRVSTSYTVFI